MTVCTICAAPTPGDDDANNAWCPDCFARHICPPRDDTWARELTREVERRLSVSRLAQTLRRN